MSRRIAAIVVLLSGAAFVITVTAGRLFPAASAFDRLADDVRPLNNAETIQELRESLAGIETVGTEFAERGTTALAQALGTTPAEAATLFAAEFPETSRTLLALPRITGDLDAVISTLDAERARFERADAIPTEGQSTVTVPWFILITGILAILLGFVMLRPSRTTAFLALGLGALVLIVQLGTQLPWKAETADQLNRNLRPIFTQQTVETLRADVDALEGMAGELQTKIVPVLSNALQVPQEQAQAFVDNNFPTLSAALPRLDGSIERLDANVDLIERNIADFRTVSRPDLSAASWVVLGGGIAMMLAGAWSLLARRERDEMLARARREREAA